MKTFLKPFVVCILVTMLVQLAWASPVRADHGSGHIPGEVGFEQKLDAQVPLHLAFHDENGQVVQLGDYFGEKPVILSLGYLECPMLCPVVREELVLALQELAFDVGDDFDVLVVSIDPGETAGLAAAKKSHLVQLYGRPVTEAGWHFLTGSQASIKALTESVGFRYSYDAEKDEYAHGSGVIVLTPQGKVSRYVYGVIYEPKDLRLGLVEASANQIGSPVDQILLLCYQYDPQTGQYTFAVMNVLRLAGLATVLVLGAVLFWTFRHNPRPEPERQVKKEPVTE